MATVCGNSTLKRNWTINRSHKLKSAGWIMVTSDIIAEDRGTIVGEFWEHKISQTMLHWKTRRQENRLH